VKGQCPRCKGSVALGLACLCVTLEAQHVWPMEPEAAPIVISAPHLEDDPESDLERQLETRPVPDVIGGYIMHVDPISLSLALSGIVMTEGGTSG
jgi:hypothetical protein